MTITAHDLARRLVVGLSGPHLHAAERRWLAHWRPAGVILFPRNCHDLAAWTTLVADLRATLPAAAELCADHEGGPVSFLQVVAGRPPAARTLGDLDDPALTRQVHAETGARLRACGLDRVLAPCCDVLVAGHNPVIGARSFAPVADRAARHAAAAMAGLVDAHLRGCAKHWPGHGSTRSDTHESAAAPGAVVTAAEAPFWAALDAGADMLMLGHLPTAAGRPPATLDAEAIASLRREVGAGVLLATDDVTMGALRAPLVARGIEAGDGLEGGMVDPAVLSLAWLETVAAAGCDRLLLRGIPWRALPLPDGEVGPPLPLAPPPPDLLATGADSPAWVEARRRAAAPVALRPGPLPALWFDATGADRLGEAVGLADRLRGLWPALTRLAAEDGRLAPAAAWSQLIVTSHRPLTVGQAQLLRGLAAGSGLALAAGHPSLAGDLARLLGGDWRVDGLSDCAWPDLAALAERI